MAIPVLTEVPVGVAILIMLPYFVAVIATIIYTHNKTTKSNHNNDYNSSIGKNMINIMFHMKDSSRYSQEYQEYEQY